MKAWPGTGPVLSCSQAGLRWLLVGMIRCFYPPLETSLDVYTIKEKLHFQASSKHTIASLPKGTLFCTTIALRSTL